MAVHVSGGEFNTAANLADCFRLRTAIVTAMVDYPIGELVASRVREMGETDLQAFRTRRRARPEHRHRLQPTAVPEFAGRWCFTTAATRRSHC